MKQHLALQELSTELERQLATKQDYVMNTRRMQVAAREDGTARIYLDAANEDGSMGEFKITDFAHGQFSTNTGIPKRYYDRMLTEAPDLYAKNVNHWLQTDPARRMLRTLDGNARALLSDRYRRLDNYDVAERALPIFYEQPDMQVVSAALTDTRMYIKALFPRIQGEVVPGQIVQAGAMLYNSEVGAGTVTVKPFVYALICTNGMVVELGAGEGLKKRHIGARLDEEMPWVSAEARKADDEAFFLLVRDAVRDCADQARFTQLVGSLRELRNIPVADVVGTVERLQEATGLSEEEGRGVLSHLAAGGDLSAWGVVNAVTRMSQDVESYERATELETLGGRLAAKRLDEWEALAQAA